MRYCALTLAAFLLTATAGYAQTADPLPKKLAVIDFDYAVLNNLDGIKAKRALDVRLKYWQDKSDVEAAKRKTLTDKLVDPGTSEGDKVSLNRQVIDIDLGLKRLREDAQKDLEAKRVELFNGISDRVRKILTTYSEEHALAAVFNDAGRGDSAIIFRSGAADITSEIIRRVNADIEKGPAKPATTSPKP